MPYRDSANYKNSVSVVVEFTKIIDNNKKTYQILMHTFYRFKIQYFSLILISDSQRTNTHSKFQSTVTWLTHKPTIFKKRKSIPALAQTQQDGK